MNKTILLLAVLGFLMPNFVFATSGSCSSHNGVNCGSGPDWDRSVICNDGWTESSVNYTSADECQDNIACSSSQYQSLFIKYGLNTTKDQITSLNNQIASINAQASQDIENVPVACGGECPSAVIYARQKQIVDQATDQITLLHSQIDSSKAKLRVDVDSVISECKAMGYDRVNQMYLQALARHTASAQVPVITQPITPIIQPEIKVEPKQNTIIKPKVKLEIKKPVPVKIITSTPSTTPVIVQTVNTPTPQIIKEPIKKVGFVNKIFNFFIKLFK